MEKLNSSYLLKSYHSTKRRILLLDYEGTLTDENQTREYDWQVDAVLTRLADDNRNSVVVLSDSSAAEINGRITDHRLALASESGGLVRLPGGIWQQIGDFYLSWKEPVSTALRRLAGSYPNTTIVEKQFSVRWEYGRSIDHLAESDQRQLRAAFRIMSSRYNVPIVETPNSIEFRAAGISKAKFVASWMNLHGPCDFILSIGDDKSDEDIFNLVGPKFITVRVGFDPASAARYYLPSRDDVLPFLKSLVVAV